MPQTAIGDLFTHARPGDLLLFPACAVLDARGALVMGAGAALAFKSRFPGLPGELGKLITALPVSERQRFGLSLAPPLCGAPFRLGAFQSKMDWRDASSLETVAHSSAKLKEYLELHPELRVHLAMPGQ